MSSDYEYAFYYPALPLSTFDLNNSIIYVEFTTFLTVIYHPLSNNCNEYHHKSTNNY